MDYRILIYEDLQAYLDERSASFSSASVSLDFDTIDELLAAQKIFVEQGKVVVAFMP